MVEVAPHRMTLAEFLVWDDGTDARYELISGVVRRMPIPFVAHGMIVGNCCMAIHGHVRGSRCRALVGGGIVPPHRRDTWYRADFVVTCAPPRPDSQWVSDPLVIVEVLLAETAAHDRGTKLPDYIRIPSVREIVVIDSTQRRVQLWRRCDDTSWIVEDLAGDALLRLRSIDQEIPLAALYDGVALE